MSAEFTFDDALAPMPHQVPGDPPSEDRAVPETAMNPSTNGTVTDHSTEELIQESREGPKDPHPEASKETTKDLENMTIRDQHSPTKEHDKPLKRLPTRRRNRVSLQFLPIHSDSSDSGNTSTPHSPPLQETIRAASAPSSSVTPSRGMVYGEPGGSFILRRIQKTREQATAQTAEAREASQSGLRELQQNFAERRTSSGSSSKGAGASANMWEFWAQVMTDYPEVARCQPAKLRKAIQQGFPAELRGLLWQVIARSKSPALEQLYASLVLVQDADCANAIAKDVNRTALANATTSVDRDDLFRVLKAYSLFDPDVGYTQGMAFVATLLLDVGMTEYEVFCLYVQLMKAYDLRSFYLPDMPGLHVKLYQFDRLVEDRLEGVHLHLKRQGVHSSMYASQWFLTLFSYRFPVDLVRRILDIVIAEGTEAILRFALVLMEASAAPILSMKFDELLPFLKEQVFDVFVSRPNDLVREAGAVELNPAILAQYELEFSELTRLERERTDQVDALRAANSRLTLQVRQLETELSKLNSEHIEIANKMVASGLEVARLRHDNDEMARELQTYREATQSFQEMSEVVREKNELAEVRVRLERQIEGLQEALAQTM